MFCSIDRQLTNSFNDSPASCRARISASFLLQNRRRGLVRSVEAHPFVPPGEEQLAERCGEISRSSRGTRETVEHIGAAGRDRRFGGLDSTLALLVGANV